MFSKRPDGVLAKDIDPITKIMPYIMYNRNDASNMTTVKVDCGPMDEFIKARLETGVRYTYMDLMLAAMVRTMHHLPHLNRFVVNGRVYKRNKITASVAIHRSLRGDEAESNVKVDYDGTETLAEIKERFDTTVRKEIFECTENGTDKLVNVILSIPAWLIKAVVNFLMWMDRHNILPKAIIKFSPFHTTFWITNLKSLGIDTIFHHIYNFGTTSQFLALGKERYVPVVVSRDKIVIKKTLEMGFVMDERICDGLYYARATKLLHKLLKNPELLEQPPVDK